MVDESYNIDGVEYSYIRFRNGVSILVKKGYYKYYDGYMIFVIDNMISVYNLYGYNFGSISGFCDNILSIFLLNHYYLYIYVYNNKIIIFPGIIESVLVSSNMVFKIRSI